MENQQIRRLTIVLGVVLVILLLIVGLRSQQGTSNPLGQVNYTNSVTGAKATYYTSKGLETQPLGLVIDGTDGLYQTLGDSKAADSIAALKQFVNTQSHYNSHNAAVSNFGQTGDNAYSFRLFIESSQTFYDVSLDFDSQQIPQLTYEVNPSAQF